MGRKIIQLIIAATVIATGTHAETVINGSRRILGTWDASAAASTKAARQHASDPATCSESEIYYNTSIHMHRQCSAANTWSDLGHALPTALAGQVYMSDGTAVRAVTPGSKIAGDGTTLKYTTTDLTSIDLRDDFYPRFTMAGPLVWRSTQTGTLFTDVSAANVADPEYGSRSRVSSKASPVALDQAGLILGPFQNLGEGGHFNSWDMRAMIWHDTAGTAAGPPADYAFQFGFNTTAHDASYGIMLIYDPADTRAGCGPSPNWRFWIRNGALLTQCVDSGVQVQARTKYRLRIWSPQPGTVLMSVNGTQSPVFATSLPPAQGQNVWINCITLKDGAQKSFDVARFAFHMDGLPE